MPTRTRSSASVSCIAAYGGSLDFLDTFKPANQTKYCKGAESVRRCYTGKAPTLRTVSSAYGENIAELWLTSQLKDLSEFSGSREKLSVEQLDELARIINADFSGFRVTELMHFFSLFKAGHYGRFYGAVDGLAITEALQEFRRERDNLLWEESRKREKERRAKEEAIRAKEVMTFDEWKELRHLFNFGYEPWRIKREKSADAI